MGLSYDWLVDFMVHDHVSQLNWKIGEAVGWVGVVYRLTRLMCTCCKWWRGWTCLDLTILLAEGRHKVQYIEPPRQQKNAVCKQTQSTGCIMQKHMKNLFWCLTFESRVGTTMHVHAWGWSRWSSYIGSRHGRGYNGCSSCKWLMILMNLAKSHMIFHGKINLLSGGRKPGLTLNS